MEANPRERKRDARGRFTRPERPPVRPKVGKNVRKMVQAQRATWNKDRVQGQQGTPVAGLFRSPAQARQEVQFQAANKPNWAPLFCTYNNFNKMVLQALDGFMLALSTDRIIVFVSENVSALLGYEPEEVKGQELSSLLPDHEKDEVYQKINLTLPLSFSVGNHIEFCCYLKRKSTEQERSPTYEYVKFILSLKDIGSEPFLYSARNRPCTRASISKPALEDRFYLVGTVCIVKTEILRELYIARRTNEAVVVQDSDDEQLSQGCRKPCRRQCSTVRPLHSKPPAILNDKISSGEVEQFGSPGDTHVIQVHSDTSEETSVSSLKSAVQCIEFEHKIDPKKWMDPVDIEFSVDSEYLKDSLSQDLPLYVEDSVDQKNFVRQEHSVHQEDSVGQKKSIDQEKSVVEIEVSTEDQETITNQEGSVEQKDSVASEALMQEVEQQALVEPKFPEGSVNSVDQKAPVEPVAQKVLPSSSVAAGTITQIQPTIWYAIVISNPQSVEVVSKKQHSGNVKKCLSDGKDAKRFCSSRYTFKFTESKDPHGAFPQQKSQNREGLLEVQLQMQQLQAHKMEEQVMQQQLLQKKGQEQQLQQQVQEQPLQKNVTAANKMAQLRLPDLSVVPSNDPFTFLQNEPLVSVREVAEEQPSGSHQNEDFEHKEDEILSFFTEKLPAPLFDEPLLMSPCSETVSVNSSQPLLSLEHGLDTTDDFMEAWKEPRNLACEVLLQTDAWLPQVPDPLQNEFMEHQAEPDNLNVFLPIDLPDLDDLRNL